MAQQSFIETTEAPSLYENLDKMSVFEMLKGMNEEDKKVPFAVETALPQIEAFVIAAYERCVAQLQEICPRENRSRRL